MMGYGECGWRMDEVRSRRRRQLSSSLPVCGLFRRQRPFELPVSSAERRLRVEQYRARRRQTKLESLEEKEKKKLSSTATQSPSRLKTAKPLRSISKMRFLHKRKAFKKKMNFVMMKRKAKSTTKVSK